MGAKKARASAARSRAPAPSSHPARVIATRGYSQSNAYSGIQVSLGEHARCSLRVAAYRNDGCLHSTSGTHYSATDEIVATLCRLASIGRGSAWPRVVRALPMVQQFHVVVGLRHRRLLRPASGRYTVADMLGSGSRHLLSKLVPSTIYNPPGFLLLTGSHSMRSHSSLPSRTSPKSEAPSSRWGRTKSGCERTRAALRAAAGHAGVTQGQVV